MCQVILPDRLHLRIIDALVLVHGKYIHADGADQRRYSELLFRLRRIKQRDFFSKDNLQNNLTDSTVFHHFIEQKAVLQVQFF